MHLEMIKFFLSNKKKFAEWLSEENFGDSMHPQKPNQMVAKKSKRRR